MKYTFLDCMQIISKSLEIAYKQTLSSPQVFTVDDLCFTAGQELTIAGKVESSCNL